VTTQQSAGERPRLLVRWWERRKSRAFPRGAVRFHLSGWARSGLSPDEAEVAQALLRSHGFEALYVLHGNALASPGEGVLLVLGPPGVGKSTVAYSLVREGRAELVEDGLAVVGSRHGRWHLLATGTSRILTRASLIGARLRRLTGSRRSVFLDAEIDTSGLRWRMYRFRAWMAFTLAVLLTRDRESFSPSLLPVARLVVAEHPAVFRPELRIDRNGQPQLIRDISRHVPESVGLLCVSSVGGAAEVKKRLRRAILELGSDTTEAAAAP